MALVCSSGVWADTSLLTGANGWQKITSIPSNVGDYYFTIVDNSSDLMLTLSRGQNQDGNYNGLYYKTSSNPLADKSMLFTLEAYNGFYVMTNVEYDRYFLQTEYNAAYFYRTHDNGGGNKDWGKIKLTYTETYWTIQNGQYPVEDGNYLGVWNDNATPANGLEIALNKPSSMKGTYQIYAILKTDANAYYDALRAGTGASEATPLDMTGLIVNPNARFWTGSIPFGWTTTGTQNVNNGTGYDGFPGIFEFSNWGADSWTGSLKQTITVPNGKYILKAAFMAADGVTAHLTANNDVSADLTHFGDAGGNINADGTETTMGSGQRGYTYLTLETKVTTGQIEIGAYAEASAKQRWVNADNFTLTYLGADLDILKDSYANALAAAGAIDQEANMETSVLEALQNAISTYKTVAQTEAALNEAINALQAATSNANASIAAYNAVPAYFDKMKGVLDNTNVYTQEAYDAYYGTWWTQYQAKTLETSIAASLTENVAYSTGWHSNNNIDDILLSTWTIGGEQVKNYDKALYINTWSTEGNTDGSEFFAPFFEYWVSSGNVLAANTFTSTVSGLNANETYSVTIRARVQPTDGQTIKDNAVQMQVGSGTPVTISAGAKFGATNYYIGNFSAIGTTDASGNLVTTITVAENSNVSWLSFYNVRYTKGEDLSAFIADYEFALSNVQNALNNDTQYAGYQTGLSSAAAAYGNVDRTNKAALIEAKNALESALNDYNNQVAPLKGSMLTGWTTTGNNGQFHVNGWSGEGATDGSNMVTPFIENWINKGSILTDADMGYKLEGQTSGYYKVTGLIRTLNEAGGSTPAGSFLFANKAIARAYEGTTCTNGVYDNPVVYGFVGSDGVLTIGVKVINANFNWVSWKNLTIEYVGPTLTQEIANALTAEARTFQYSNTAKTAQEAAIAALASLTDANYVAAGEAIEAAYRADDKPEATLAIGSAKWATFIAPFEVTLPAGVKAYTVDAVENNVLMMTEVTEKIAANTPVVLNAETTVNELVSGTMVASTDLSEGLLTGTYEEISAPVGSYVLQMQGTNVGFFKVEDVQPKVKANRAYLTAPAAGGVKAFFLGDTEDAIKGVFDGVAVGEIYDLAGRKVQNMQKGNVYIVNGKKVIVK